MRCVGHIKSILPSLVAFLIQKFGDVRSANRRKSSLPEFDGVRECLSLASNRLEHFPRFFR